ncbi:MAG: HAMP domain-containing histidine kinase [Helicobacteraceae bacterium]|jgi:two-component system OmpR family sensor kinase|nr:HAMP domain-containing histidine kinase [Helicobacteraceae bacterium]
MIKEEKKALRRFLLLYAGSLVLFLGIIGSGYYRFHSAQIFKAEQRELRLMMASASRSLMKRGETPSEEIEWALLDRNGRMISGTFDPPKNSYEAVPSNHDSQERFMINDKHIYCIMWFAHRSQFLVVRMPINAEAFESLIVNLVLIWGGAFVFFMVIAGFLTAMFLKPLRDTIELLDRFIKDTTHEMTTPISAILMSAEGFDRGALNERDKRRLGRIEVAARTLQAVYDDLAFMINPKTKRAPQEIDLARLIKERVEFFEPSGRIKQIEYKIEIADHVPLIADPREFTRILDNLLSNAIKYNKQGGAVRVIVSGSMLAIEDDGNGIAIENRKKIFERFTRLDDAQGGFGLGLSIVKELCARNSLTVRVADSRVTRFQIEWQKVKKG